MAQHGCRGANHRPGEKLTEVIDGQETCEGGEANGTTTPDHGSWANSFRFVDDLAEG